MNASNHVKIFSAYLSRLTEEDAVKLSNAIHHTWHCSYNLSISSQLEAQNKLNELVLSIIEKLSGYDKHLIETIIEKNLV